MPSTIGKIDLSRRETALMVYRASRRKGWGPIRSSLWAIGAWRRWPNGMHIEAKVIA